MTPEQLDEIEKLAEAATPGPWKTVVDEFHADSGAHQVALHDCFTEQDADKNAAFIRAMREYALPLVKALEEAWKEREDYRNDAIAAENECDRMLTSTALLTYLVEELVQVPRNGNRIEKLVEQSRTHLLRLREYEGSDE